MKQQIPSDVLRQCLFLAGPTAVGKTEVTLALAEQLAPIEILSLDSMCIYRSMDVGTAKPSTALQQRVPHHLIDLAEPHEEFSVADYIAAARAACEGILDRGARPVFVGGTGLYLRSILRGVFEGPPADPAIRGRLQKLADEAATRGDHYWLMRQLEAVDPDAMLRLHPNDHRRLIRAIEVFELTGKPLSEQQKQEPLPSHERPPHVYWLSPPRDWLHERINRRVELMMEQGLVDEVQRLLSAEQPIGRTARQGLGYKEVIESLEAAGGGDLSEQQVAEMVDVIQTRTRQFAKRQHTWFRNLEECHEIELTGTESPEQVAASIVARVR
ncbi:tRNA (adenosine(37)-N6)-dimethylallyltransferase MiaA [bacterium]|nr:tRNA (adenosine(37)-N6)-dimethylallyltransferase MiaA [bacterium]